MFLGIDVGTGGTRAILIDRAGKVLASHSAEHAAIHSEFVGWAEQEPEDWWRAAQEAIAGALEAAVAAGHSEAVEAVGLTGQMHGCVMLDAAGEVLRPALIWCDQRTQPQCDWLTETIGYERLIELTANPALPNFTLTKLLWVREEQPEIFAKIAHVLCPKDFVRLRMTGTYAMDMQEASGTLLLDVVHRRWSTEMAELTGIPMSWLPPLFEGPEICAQISEGRYAGGGGRGRPGCGRGGDGNFEAGIGVCDDWDFGRSVCRDGGAYAGSEGPVAYVLPCGSGSVARDGRDQWGGA
jgi:xylulokinase